MKKLILFQSLGILIALATAPINALASETIYLPNLGATLQGTDVSGAKSMNVFMTGGALTVSEQATAANGSAVPALSKVVAGSDGTLTRTLKTDASGNLQTGRTWSLLNSTDSVNAVQSGTWTTGRTWSLASGTDSVASVQSGTWNLTNISGIVSLPTGAAISAKQPALGTAGTASADVITVQGIASMTALKVDNSAVTQPTNITQVAGASIATGHGTASGAIRVELPTDGTGVVNAAQSGTWNINNLSGTVSLPTGAATSANQTTANTSLSSIATNTAKTPINTTGSGSSAGATVSTVQTLSAPANAVGFILMNLSNSTDNIRWAVGRTASTTLGQRLEPGRDTGFVPVGASVSVIAESGTQNIDIQWVSQ